MPLHQTDHKTSSYSWAECVTTEVIENDIPLLLSKDTMKKANTYIDFANDKIILNKKVPVKFTTSGHYCIPMGKIVDDNHDKVLKSESILFCDDVNELSNVEKEKIAIKLQRQFSHPSSDKLIPLLKDANINDIIDHLTRVSASCVIKTKRK